MKFVIATLLALSSSSAFAITYTTQTLTPKANQNEITGSANYVWGSATLTNLAITQDTTGYSLPLTYYYGLTDNHSLGIETGYQSADLKTKNGFGASASSTRKGMSDVQINYKGNFELGMPTLFVAAGLSIPLEKRKDNNFTGDSNVSSGQMAINFGGGVIVPVSIFKLGGLVTYSLKQQGDIEDTSTLNITTSGDLTGGNKLQVSGIAEVENFYHTNLQIIYAKIDQRDEKINGISSRYSTELESLEIDISLRMALNENIEIIPTVAYQTLLNKDTAGVDKYDLYGVGAKLRLTF